MPWLSDTSIPVDIETEWNLKAEINRIFCCVTYVDIETEWNLKIKKKWFDMILSGVDIETEWNLKCEKPRLESGFLVRRYRNRMEFKGK